MKHVKLFEAFENIADLTKALHFELDPKTAEEMKIELGKRQGEVSKRKQIEGGDYSLRRFRKSIKFGDGTYLGVFLPGSYDAATSTLGDGPHKKAVKKIKWTQKKYDQWLEDVASNDGWKNASDMAQNAKNEPGLIDWVKKNNRGEDAMQRIQWDIEAFAESVVTEAKFTKADISYQLALDYSGRTAPRVKKFTSKEIHVVYGYKVDPQSVIDSIKILDPNLKVTHIKWNDISSGGGTHSFKINESAVTEKMSLSEIKKITKTKEYKEILQATDNVQEVSDIWNMLDPKMFKFTEDEFEDIFDDWWNTQSYDSLEEFSTGGSTEDAITLYKHLLPYVTESVVTEAKSKVDVASLSIGNTYKDSKGYLVKVMDIAGSGDTWYIGLKDRFGKTKVLKGSLDKGVNLYESVVTEAKMSKEKIESLIWSLENEKDSWHPSSASKKKSMLDKLKKDLSKFESVVTEAVHYVGPFIFSDTSTDTELLRMYDDAVEGASSWQRGMQYSKGDYEKAYKTIEVILKKRGVAIVESEINEAFEYVTDKLEKGDEIEFPTLDIKFIVTEVNFKPNKRYKDAFVFKDDKRLSIYPPPTSKDAVGYKLEDVKDSSYTAFYYCYKTNNGIIMKLAIKGFNESVNEDNVTFTLDDGGLDDKFLSKREFSRNLDYKEDGRDTYYVLPRRDFDRFQDWADSSGYDTDEVIDVIEESTNEGLSKSSIKKMIKDINKQIETETGGDGESLDNETLQALEQERERLEAIIEGVLPHINEGRASAKTLLTMVVNGNASDVEGIKLSKDMADAYLHWMNQSTYGKRFSDLPFYKLFSASFNWGIERYIGRGLKPELKELKQKASEMRKSEVFEAKVLNRAEITDFLEKYLKFIKNSEEFDGVEGGIWTTAEDGAKKGGLRIFDYYNESSKYEFGVLKSFADLLSKRGWYCEFYDPGTVMIWEE